MGHAVTNSVTEIATQPSGVLALRVDQMEWTSTQRAAFAQIGVENAPDGDLQVFLHVAQRSGLDPFARQIYMISRKDQQSGKLKWTIQTGIDGYRVIAERRREYGGQVGPQWCGEDGAWRDMWAAKEPPIAARVGVIRKGWEHPVWGVAHFNEFKGAKYGGGLTHMWATMPANQIAKCAESAALRKAFPQDFAGVYIDEEMEHLNNPAPRIVIDSERAAEPEPDWDILIQRYESNADQSGLADLRKLAVGFRPNDSELLERISVAIERVKDALDRAEFYAADEFRSRALIPNASRAGLLKLHDDVRGAAMLGAPVEDEDGQLTSLGDLIIARGRLAKEREDAASVGQLLEGEPTRTPITRESLLAKDRRGLERHLFALLGEGGIKDAKQGRETRLDAVSRLVASRLCVIVPSLTSLNDLPDDKLIDVILALDEYQCAGRLVEELAELTKPVREENGGKP